MESLRTSPVAVVTHRLEPSKARAWGREPAGNSAISWPSRASLDTESEPMLATQMYRPSKSRSLGMRPTGKDSTEAGDGASCEAQAEASHRARVTAKGK